MKYRSRADLVAEILKVATPECNKTDIMYDVHLSYHRTNIYIDQLKENHLLQYNEKTRLYKITEKGRKFLQAYETMNELFPNPTETIMS